MPELSIRPAGGGDLPRGVALLVEIADFHRQIEPGHYGTGRPVAYHENRLANLMRDPDRGVALIAEEEPAGAAAGLILVHLQASDAPGAPTRVALIGDIVVTADRRRQGIGRRLIEAARDWAATRGADRMVLNVREANPEAVRFYESLGYRTVARWMAAPVDPTSAAAGAG